MPWGTAIFLTLLLSAIGWPLLHTSPKKNEEERKEGQVVIFDGVNADTYCSICFISGLGAEPAI